MFDKLKLNDDTFEDLCLQIAKQEFGDSGKIVPINGIGGDGGREFYLELENGKRWCWQCKFFDKIGSSQRTQIKKSLETNKRNDGAKLEKRILCLPIDLTDTIIQANGNPKTGQWSFIEQLRRENEGIEIVLRVKSDFDTFCITYPNINNYFFGDEKQQREAEIEMIKEENIHKAKNQAEIEKEQINNIFVGGREEDIFRSKLKYYKYNLQKLRCMDHKLIIDDIENLEKSIDVCDLDSRKFKIFQKEVQDTVKNYFSTYTPEKEILKPTYNFILNDIGKQIGCILTLGISGKFKFNYDEKTDIYSMNINNG